MTGTTTTPEDTPVAITPSRSFQVPIDSPLRTGPMLRSATMEGACLELISLVYPGPSKDRAAALRLARARRLQPHANTADPDRRRVFDQLASTGVTLRLRPEVWPEVTQAVQSRLETARRRRAARMFGLPPLRYSTFSVPWLAPRLSHDTRMALRVLAAARPLYIDEVLEAVAQTWKPFKNHVPDYDRLVASLVAAGATTLPGSDKWTFTGPAHPQDLAIIEAARRTGRARHTVAQIEEILARAGVNVARHAIPSARLPLIVRTRWNTYQVMGA